MIDWGDSVTNNVGVANQYLIGIEAHFMGRNLYLPLLWCRGPETRLDMDLGEKQVLLFY